MNNSTEQVLEQNDALMEAFEEALKNKGYSRRTTQRYVNCAEAFLYYVVEGTDTIEPPIDFMKATDCVEWYLERLFFKIEESEERVKMQARSIKAFYKWLLEEGKITQDMMDKVIKQTKTFSSNIADEGYMAFHNAFP